MIRRGLFLFATSAMVLTLGFFLAAAGAFSPAQLAAATKPAPPALRHSAALAAPPADDALSTRLQAVAGAGMLGSHTFDYLSQLSDEVGARVTGSPEAAKAVEWGLATMRSIGLENVHAEHWQLWRGWTRGTAEAWLISPTRRKLMVDSMGWVGSTATGGADADVVEVDLNKLSDEMSKNSRNWAGKILLVTRKGPRPTNNAGVSEFGKFGEFLVKAHDVNAVAVIGGQGGAKAAGIKLTHTGILGFTTYYEIPVVSMAAEDQGQLERLIEAGKPVKLHMNVQNTATDGPVDAANAVGEIRGTEHPEQVLVVGGHLDSWDLAEGTTDNGCGSATTLGAAEAIMRSGLKPKRTIRFVLFTGEEQGLIGSREYVKSHQQEMANHLGVIVLDAGQGAVNALDLGGRDDLYDVTIPFAKSLGNFGVTDVKSNPGFGTDNGPFILAGLPGIELVQDTSQYWLTHHSPADTLDKVDPATITRNSTIEAILAFWIADRPERYASPWPPQKTEKMLKDTHHEEELKVYGLWPFGGR
jgi:carboxypeptidase Q